MAEYQVAWNPTDKVATIQALGDVPPALSTKVGEFVHSGVGDPEGPDVSHVLWHHVRDALYHAGHYDMQIVSIVVDTTYTPLESISVTPPTANVAVSATTQLTVAPTPGGATNTAVTWSTSDATKATVSPTGLVTGVAAGSVTITATSQDGGFTDTCVVTVTA